MSVLPRKIEEAIEAFSSLPGIGPKSAARIVFFLQKAPIELSESLSAQVKFARKDIKICTECFNFSDDSICSLCQDDLRQSESVLVVEDSLDLVAIEKTGVFKGLYHVLGGIISPLNGVGPDEIRIKELLQRLGKFEGEIELIIATNPNMEGEATALYIQQEIEKEENLKDRINITRLARGLSTGADIDYADDLTIRKAFEGRVKL